MFYLKTIKRLKKELKIMSQKLIELEALIAKIHPNQPTDLGPINQAVTDLRVEIQNFPLTIDTLTGRVADLETALTEALAKIGEDPAANPALNPPDANAPAVDPNAPVGDAGATDPANPPQS